jgi:hypothetical protein
MRRRVFSLGFAALAIAFGLNQIIGLTTNDQYVRFLEITFSSDGIITCPEYVIRRINETIFSVGLVWMVLFLVRHKQILKEFNIRNIRHLNLIIKVAYLLAFLLTFSWFFLKNRELYKEDHLFQNFTALLLFGSSSFMGARLAKPGGLGRWCLFSGAMFFFILGMEEISWGQRIFNWETPEAWSKVNYQDETNVHNLFNPILKYIYAAGNLLLGYGLLSVSKSREFCSRFSWWENISPFSPSVGFSLFGYIFLFLSIQVVVYGGELTEEVFSVLGIAYTTTMFSVRKRQPDPAGKKDYHAP